MFINKGQIYTSWQGQRYRVAGFTKEKNVICALLVPPGGNVTIERAVFDKDFAPEVPADQRPQEDRREKKQAKRVENPYIPDAQPEHPEEAA